MKPILFLLTLLLPLAAGVLKQPEAAISQLYPGATVEKKRALLKSSEAAAIEAAAKQKLSSKIITYYTIQEKGQLCYAVLQTTKVRSKTMTALTFVEKGAIAHIEMIAFYEPAEYLPSERWLETIEGKGTADAIQPKRDIPTITGATLSANAVAKTARLALAFVRVKLEQP